MSELANFGQMTRNGSDVQFLESGIPQDAATREHKAPDTARRPMSVRRHPPPHAQFHWPNAHRNLSRVCFERHDGATLEAHFPSRLCLDPPRKHVQGVARGIYGQDAFTAPYVHSPATRRTYMDYTNDVNKGSYGGERSKEGRMGEGAYRKSTRRR